MLGNIRCSLQTIDRYLRSTRQDKQRSQALLSESLVEGSRRKVSCSCDQRKRPEPVLQYQFAHRKKCWSRFNRKKDLRWESYRCTIIGAIKVSQEAAKETNTLQKSCVHTTLALASTLLTRTMQSRGMELNFC